VVIFSVTPVYAGNNIEVPSSNKERRNSKPYTGGKKRQSAQQMLKATAGKNTPSARKMRKVHKEYKDYKGHTQGNAKSGLKTLRQSMQKASTSAKPTSTGVNAKKNKKLAKLKLKKSQQTKKKKR